jgi:hypothetical protein
MKLAMRIRRIVIYGLSGSTVFVQSLKWHAFRKKKVTEHKIPVLILSTILSETFLILRRTERDIINIHGSLCKVPNVLRNVQQNLNFINRFSKKIHIKVHENP